MLNNFNNFKQIIQPFLPNIVVGCESTYAYYWLADGCHGDRIPFYLGHALYMKAIGANKQKNDKIDAKTIAELMRTNFFPEAYPYPKLMRPARDLLRRRHRLVSIRSEAYSHIQMVAHQYAIEGVGSAEVKNKQTQQNLLAKFEQYNLTKLIETDLDIINALNPVIAKIEKEIQVNAVHHNAQDLMILQTAPGIGDILSLVILYETHDVKRFPAHQKYASYSRIVRSHQTSNGKIVGKKHSKMGNPYLKWAFNSIIITAQQNSERIRRYYNKLESRYGRPNARARIAHKFNIAVYYMLKNKQPFNEARFLNIN
jgi:transposase